jgi:hypothetical protein
MMVPMLQFSSHVIPAKAGIPVFLQENADARFRGHDGDKKSIKASPANPTSRAFRPTTNPQNSEQRKAWQKHSPPFLFHAESGAHLS